MNNSVFRNARLRWVGCAALGLLATVILSTRSHSDEPSGRNAPRAAAKPAAVAAQIPEYTDEGELKLPEDFATWIFVGSNLGIEYREDGAGGGPPEKDHGKDLRGGNFHNVYVNPDAYGQFVRTGKFPDKTMLVLDVYRAEQGAPGSIVSQGLFPGKRKEIAVAVKNNNRPDGMKTDWAYYDFSPDQKTAKAFPDKACYDCHLQHADVDNVWVQFYPTLRAKRANQGP